MNLQEAIKKYGDKFPAVKEYEEADEFVYINEGDPDLQKWRVEMPIPPDWKLIEGFGKKPREQKFEYEVYPPRLKKLETDVRDELNRVKKKSDSYQALERMFFERMWEILDVGRDEYKEELDWIRLQWFFRLNGKWLFIKGKPHFITGSNHWYLNYYSIEGGTEHGSRPSYRWRDYKWFHALNYAKTTTETVVYEEREVGDEKVKEPVLLDDGTCKMRDIGSRTVLGINVLKGRRVGDSSKNKSDELEEVTRSIEFAVAFQADTDDNAKKIYTKLTRFAFHRLPFFFMPKTPNLNTTEQITLRGISMNDGLNSNLDFRASGETAYDGSRINRYSGDEIGKTKNADIIKRHSIVERTLTPGSEVLGTMVYTSTAEEMDSDVGKNFEDFTMKSMFENRGVNGRTSTGLINVYFSIEESFQGFLDPFGYPVIDNPTDQEVIDNLSFVEYNDKGEVMGVTEYLKATEKKLIDEEDMVGLSSHQRKNPKSFRECFSNAAHNLMFDRVKLQARVTQIKFNNNKCIKGNFIRNGNVVDFHPCEDGRFNVSMRLPAGRNSRMRFDGVTYRPMFDDVFIASADTYKVSVTDSRRKSLGSMAVLWKHDPDQDGPDKPTRDWVSQRFVCTYLYRPPTLNEYFNDVLNCCIYYNCLLYPEYNITNLADYFSNNGYGGYLMYDIDIKSGKPKQNPGFTLAGSRGNIKDTLFNLGADYVNLHAHKEEHAEVLEEFLFVKSLDDLKNRDLLASILGCLKGQQSLFVDRIRRFNTMKYDISGFYPKK